MLLIVWVEVAWLLQVPAGPFFSPSTLCLGSGPARWREGGREGGKERGKERGREGGREGLEMRGNLDSH